MNFEIKEFEKCFAVGFLLRLENQNQRTETFPDITSGIEINRKLSHKAELIAF